MIFCVEDDEAIRNMMLYTLHASGFKAEGFPDGVTFLEALERQKPQLVLLDVMLPGMDGIEILKEIRAGTTTQDIPVIMASAKGTEYDKVRGLDLGADDYLAKPFGMMEMVSRVKAVLRRTEPQQDPEKVIRMGNLELNPREHTVRIDGKSVPLTRKEYELLRLFLSNIGRVFTRDQLLNLIWGEEYYGETRTVDVHIGSLRTKLGDCGSWIHTVRGVGYRMEATA